MYSTDIESVPVKLNHMYTIIILNSFSDGLGEKFINNLQKKFYIIKSTCSNRVRSLYTPHDHECVFFIS